MAFPARLELIGLRARTAFFIPFAGDRPRHPRRAARAPPLARGLLLHGRDGRNAWLLALRCGGGAAVPTHFKGLRIQFRAVVAPVQGKVTPCGGHAIGEADGMIGTLTRRVIVLEQQRLGMQPEDGRAGMNVLQAPQQGSPTL